MILVKEFTKGIIKENPIFILLLGLCPTLAVTTSVSNAIGMGCATTFVLFFANIIVSTLKRIIPSQIRIPCYIVIIATFVTIVELLMKAYFSLLNAQLGIYIPLIVVNCIILGRAEAFASKKSILSSIIDALGMGVGFTISLILIATFREILGAGTIFDVKIFNDYKPVLVLTLAPGAFLTLGLLLGFFNFIGKKKG